ncbi:recombinase family protein [Streptomyces sp. NPDC050743]|uniref:recombinase family protein n=1 Tax=Streptomyces sp. NPDC050743 TaxID=3365634 RepID=UPI00379179F2
MLVPDDTAATVVQRIFEEYLAEKSLQDIAAGLTSDGIPTPGAGRSGPGRRAASWSKGAVRSILVNPRYAGYATGGESACGSGGGTAMGCPPIIPAETFEQVDRIFAARRVASASHAATDGNRYLLRGMMRCARCNRLMQGTRNNGESYYRCRIPSDHLAEHPRNVYLREQAVVAPLLSWLGAMLTARGLSRALSASGAPVPGVHQLAVVDAAGRRLRGLRSASEEERAEFFRSLGMRLTYADASRTLRVKLELESGVPALRSELHV